MAKSRREEGQGRIKVRVIEYEMEGSDESLQEGLRLFAAAISKPKDIVYVQPMTPAIGQPDLQLPAMTSNGSGDVMEEESNSVEIRPVKGSTPRRPKSVRSPNVIKMDLVTATRSLKDFCEAKNPNTISRKYLVIAAWLKHYGEVPVFTVDHIHTCFRHMGWHTPKDADQPLRDLKSKNQWVDKRDGKGEYEINHVGENEVNKMGS